MNNREMDWDNFDALLEGCHDMGIIRSEREASELLGKTPSYLSCQRARHRPVSVDALVHLYLRLGDFAAIYRRAANTATTIVEAKVYDEALERLAEMRKTVWSQVEDIVRG